MMNDINDYIEQSDAALVPCTACNETMADGCTVCGDTGLMLLETTGEMEACDD